MKAIVITVSDGVIAGTRRDDSGAAVERLLSGAGFAVERRVVADGVESVENALRAALADGGRLVVTTGGTGFSPRDLTPEGTRRVIDREAPGLAEAMRAAGRGNPHGMLSRGVCGIVGGAVVVNLPGSPGGAEESLEAVLPALRHAVELAGGEQSPHGGASG